MLANIRHENPEVQFAVLRCLGLCCILDKVCCTSLSRWFVLFVSTELPLLISTSHTQNLAKQNIGLFLECLKEEEGDVKVILQTVFDVGMTFGMDHFTEDNKPCELVKCAQPYLQHQDPEIQAIAVEGFTKWLLLRATDSFDVLGDLVVLYFQASTQSNPRAAQCLSYFLQAFSFSSAPNQLAMAKAFMETLRRIGQISKDDQAVSLLLAAQQYVEWTDSHHLVNQSGSQHPQPENAHVQMALDIMMHGMSEPSSNSSLSCHYTPLFGPN